MAILLEMATLVEAACKGSLLGAGPAFVRASWQGSSLGEAIREQLAGAVQAAVDLDHSSLTAAHSTPIATVVPDWPTDSELRPAWPPEERPRSVLEGARNLVAAWDGVAQGCVSLRRTGGRTGAAMAGACSCLLLEECLQGLRAYGAVLEEAAQSVPGEASLDCLPVLLASMSLVRAVGLGYEGVLDGEVPPNTLVVVVVVVVVSSIPLA